ncbi:hypothetical protein [Streptomyces boluensis]|uniref:Uncharacterized protein n=1 Tax=Streptomyces boluensis TaxID=1775135 RepID=A0A964USG0_9ACTN|nr:hypothetical protein [Streptomyces boluensis]NBE52157.1 hypothetical protein [Streptomyces boluensis]
MTFKASMDALTADAKRWDDTAAMLQTAGGKCADMTLRAQDFSFLGGDTHEAYEAVREFMKGFLLDGERAASGAGNALIKVRNTYEGSDETAKQNLKEAWEWH